MVFLLPPSGTFLQRRKLQRDLWVFASTGTGGSPECISWRNHEIEEGSKWSGGGRKVEHQHFCSTEGTRLATLEI